jgi:hypothetical protein
MTSQHKTRYVHEGSYVAEVEVTIHHDDSGWSPYLSVEDASRLDNVKNALRSGDIKAASEYGKVYEMKPLSI